MTSVPISIEQHHTYDFSNQASQNNRKSLLIRKTGLKSQISLLKLLHPYSQKSFLICKASLKSPISNLKLLYFTIPAEANCKSYKRL